MTTFINPSPTGGSNYMAFAPTVEKLKGMEDYEEWAVKVRMNLEMLEIDSWIDEGNTKPLEGDQEIVVWTKGNMSAKAYLINCITGDVLKRIQRAGWTTKHTAYETWVCIRKTVSIAVEDALHDIMTTFFKLDRAQFASLDAFLEKLHYMWKHIKSRPEMPDEVFVTVALNGIRKTNEVWYNNWIHDMEKGTKITKSDISSFLSRHANTEKQQKSSNFSTTTKKADNAAATASKPAAVKSAEKDDLCYKCPATKSGWRHIASECWVDHPEKRPESYKKRRQRQQDQQQQQGNADIATAGANFIGMTVRRQVTWAPEDEEITRNDCPALTTTESIFQDDIIVDSGCSNHCFNDKKWFTFLTDVLDDEMMTTSNGGDLRVLGQGTVKVITAEGSITLLEVYYCPDGAANMLSPGVLKRRGIVIDGYNDILAVKKTKQKVCDIFWRHGIAVLCCEKPTNPYNFAALPKNMTSSRVEYGLMHRRLVHAGQTRVLTACKKAGIDIDPATIQGYHCEACQLAKADAMISRAPLVTTNTFLAYVFWDIIETTPVGYGGYRYSLHSIDAATGFHWIIFLHTRDEAFPKLREWKEAIERMSAGHKIQVLAFDNAREFTSKKMRKWAAKEGITARWSTPYTPEQNGRVERAGRALVEAARSVCIETNLPQELWPLYMEASVYINNRLPTSSNKNNDSPIEKMFRMINVPYESYLKHIRTWGCTAYVRTPEERRIRSQKMATRAKKGMLVGLQGMRGHIYKIWLPDEQKVIRARDVRFWEQYPDRRNDPEVPDLEAILIDPEFTDDGRVLLINPPVTAPTKKVTESTHQSAEREKETPRDSEKEAEIQEKGNEPGNGDEGSHHETPRLLTPSPSLSPQRRRQEEEEIDSLLLERPFQITEHGLSDALDYGITRQLEERPEILEEPVSDCIIVHDPEVTTASRKRQPKPPPPPSDRVIRKTMRTDYKKLHNGFTLLASAYREQDEFGPQEHHYVFTTLRATQETTEDVKTVPKTWKQAVKRDDYHDVWKPAEKRQIRSLEEKGVWDLVELPQGAHALDGKWVYDMKYPKGKDPYARARWVVRGDQERGDYAVGELYAAVAHIASGGVNGSALAAAAYRGKTETVKFLVQEAATDVNMPLQCGDYGSALAAAADWGWTETVKFLVKEAAADVNLPLQSGDYGSALAAAAVSYEGTETVKFLVPEGSKVNILLQSGNYGSALAAAAYGGRIEVVKFLVQEAAAELNMPLQSGHYGSALAAAANWGRIEIIQFLIQEGAKVNMLLQSGDYGSALAAAADWGWTETVKFLVQEAAADVNMPLQSGRFGSALAAAAYWGRIETVKFLVEEAARGWTQIFKFLVKGAAVDIHQEIRCGRYGSALAAAAYWAWKACAEVLIEAGARVNLRPENRPFGNALQASRADVSQEDRKRTFWDRRDEESLKREKAEVAELLQRHGATDDLSRMPDTL
ncbi:integrase core domain protein [Ilyonectria robusta]